MDPRYCKGHPLDLFVALNYCWLNLGPFGQILASPWDFSFGESIGCGNSIFPFMVGFGKQQSKTA